MASISYNVLSENGLDNIVSKKDNMQDINLNQIKLEVHDTYKKKKKTIFEAVYDEYVTNKAYLTKK